MYKRVLQEKIKDKFFSGKAVIIVGARQTGKTTLCLNLIEDLNMKGKARLFNGDDPADRETLAGKDLDFLRSVIGGKGVVLIDEGQKIKDIGHVVKMLVDHYKRAKQIIVTGSSSVNLLDLTQEPLTGRKYVYTLFPLSLEEIGADKRSFIGRRELEKFLVYGTYPEIVGTRSFDDKRELLNELYGSYAYRDILEFQKIRNAGIITGLLKALALQIGSEVSYAELANLLGIDKNTVEHYVDLLEKSFIVFRLSPFTANRRREISKLRKIYFYDLGIRNAVINNFNGLDVRTDAGALWENFAIVERMKHRHYHQIYANQYFWRTYDGSEVDLVEERDGKLYGYELKWNERRRTRPPEKWLAYKNSSCTTITPANLAKITPP